MSTNEKIFEYFVISPRELQMMIVDEMAPRDRCLFARCSKLSSKQAKSSKNAIYGLELAGFSANGIANINVSFSEETKKDGFRLMFNERDGNHIQYLKWNEARDSWEELWRLELNNSENVVQPAKDHFKYLFEKYQNTIKMLKITANNVDIVGMNLEIAKLRNLEKLHVGSKHDIRLFLPKIRRQLKELDVEGVENCRILEEWEPTYQVQDKLTLRHINLNYSQFLRINAKIVNMPIGQLTEQDIFHFLKSWHNGTYSGRIEKCHWVLENSNFDLNSVFGLAKGLDGSTGNLRELYIEQKGSRQIAIFYSIRQFAGGNDLIFLS